jgi:hypothetical protein
MASDMVDAITKLYDQTDLFDSWSRNHITNSSQSGSNAWSFFC